MKNRSDRTAAYRLRGILRENPDGVAVPVLQGMLGLKRENSVYAALHSMPDAYIDRWEAVMANGRLATYRQVWCVVPVPAHCPRPGK